MIMEIIIMRLFWRYWDSRYELTVTGMFAGAIVLAQVWKTKSRWTFVCDSSDSMTFSSKQKAMAYVEKMLLTEAETVYERRC